MKPIPFICVLRMSKSQLLENGFKDNVIDSIYKLILENAAKDSHKIYFPDLYIPCIIQVTSFLSLTFFILYYFLILISVYLFLVEGIFEEMSCGKLL